jgi:hypothetical protein
MLDAGAQDAAAQQARERRSLRRVVKKVVP